MRCYHGYWQKLEGGRGSPTHVALAPEASPPQPQSHTQACVPSHRVAAGNAMHRQSVRLTRHLRRIHIAARGIKPSHPGRQSSVWLVRSWRRTTNGRSTGATSAWRRCKSYCTLNLCRVLNQYRFDRLECTDTTDTSV